MADNPNVGPDPVDAKPNAVREKTYDPPNPPKTSQEAKKDLSEATTRRKTADHMGEATDKVRKKL